MNESSRPAVLRHYHGTRYTGAHRFATPPLDSPYLELLRLLAEGAGLEHSLMISYLFAMFSIKDRYAKVRGDVSMHIFMEHRAGGQPEEEREFIQHSYLDVCVEEMQHLSIVNTLLAELGAAPNLMPHPFPMPADAYPFPLDLESVNRKVIAKYLWIEADNIALNPLYHQGHGDEEAFIRAVLAEFDLPPKPEMHVGSIYRRAIDCLKQSAAQDLLPADFPTGVWLDRLTALQFQGEIAHYQFFKEQFTGQAFGGDACIWDPGPDFPANELFRGTAIAGYPDTIPDEDARAVAWLADLHYWILLMLLDVGYRGRDREPRYKAIDGMTQCLWHLGLGLAGRWGVGLAFDQIGRNYGVGRDRSASLHIVREYAIEAKRAMDKAAAQGLLPCGYDRTILPELIDSLGVRNAGLKYAAVAD